MATSKGKTTKTTHSARPSGTTARKRRKTSGKPTVVFWVALVLFLIPFLVLGYFIVSAALDTGKPVLGERYKDDHDPAITKSDISSVESAVKGISGVEKADVNLATGTLRVYADISDSANAETAQSTANQIFSAVTSVLNQGTYFTQNNGMKMYDLEIHVYNQDKDEENNFVYVIETLTSSMEQPVVQLVSEPIDAELAENLRQAVENRNNPTPTPAAYELTVSEGDVEALPDDTEPQPEQPAETGETTEGGTETNAG